ncbi:MAG: hypothetical protein AAF447_19570 [Myxococcota bacterium]
MFGWFRPREGPEERPRGYREPDAPIVADIDLRNAPRRSRWVLAQHLIMSSLGLPAGLMGSFGTVSPLEAVVGIAAFVWPASTASYLWRTRRRVTRVLVRSDGRVTLERARGLQPVVGKLRLLRRARVGYWGRKRGWHLGLELEETPGAVDVLAGHRLPPELLEALEASGGPPEQVTALRIVSAKAPFRTEADLPPPVAPAAPLPVRGRLDVVRRRTVSPFVQSLPLLALGVAMVVAMFASGITALDTDHFDLAKLIGGSLAFAGLSAAYLAWFFRRQMDVTLERARGEILVRRHGEVVACLPAQPENLGWLVGRPHRVHACYLQDGRGNIALTLAEPSAELIASLRGLYEMPASARARVASEPARAHAEPLGREAEALDREALDREALDHEALEAAQELS